MNCIQFNDKPEVLSENRKNGMRRRDGVNTVSTSVHLTTGVPRAKLIDFSL